jgi:LCP family protein required for cell wall assembly
MTSMSENKYNRPRQQPQYGSIDGFMSARPKRIAVAPQKIASQIPAPTVTLRTMRKKPATPPKQPLAGKQIMLNKALPASFSAQIDAIDDTRANRKVKKKLTKKRVVIRSMLLVLVVVLGVGGFLGFRALTTLNKVFHGNVVSDVTAAFKDTPVKGESTGRVNILLAGDSSDDPGHAGAQLTDSILVLSIDTQNHTAFLLSIPRDLWVYVPGLSSYQKINAANTVANFSASGYPNGGMGQLEQIIQTQLGIPIDYYGLIDYGAFQDAVNAVGGVTITIQSPDPRGLYDPNTDLKLPNGSVTLDGKQALDLARARGDGYGSYGFPDSDFDRTDHQRQLFVAVAAKAKTLGVVANPVKISDLFNALGNNIQTDLTLQNVLRLVQITKGMDPSAAQSYAFSSTLSSTTPDPILKTYTDPASGEEALIPSEGIGDYGQLQQYYEQLTSSNPVVKEAPSVVVLNASNAVGLASKQRTILQGKGFAVSAIADANNEYTGTMIVDNSKAAKPNSLKLLQQLYPGSTVTTTTGSAEAGEASGYTADFVVILGQNWDTATTATTGTSTTTASQ